jgi:hypothetical protein
MDDHTIDHMSVSVWRLGDAWLYSISARDESGAQLVLRSGGVPGTRRPLAGLDAGTACGLILYAIATA